MSSKLVKSRNCLICKNKRFQNVYATSRTGWLNQRKAHICVDHSSPATLACLVHAFVGNCSASTKLHLVCRLRRESVAIVCFYPSIAALFHSSQAKLADVACTEHLNTFSLTNTQHFARQNVLVLPSAQKNKLWVQSVRLKS